MSTYIPIFLAILCWGIWGIVGKLATQTNSPQFVNISTNVLYALLSLFLLIPYKNETSAINWEFNAMRWIILTGVVGVGARFFFFIALSKGPASQTVALTATYPIITAILATIWLKERLSFSQTTGLVFTVVGIYLLLGKK